MTVECPSSVFGTIIYVAVACRDLKPNKQAMSRGTDVQTDG